MSIPKLEAAIDRAFEEEDPTWPKNTRAVVVLHDGELVAERYASGFGPESLLPGWSMTKSILNALYGRAVELGLLELDKPPGFPDWQDERSQIHLDHLLRMSSGLAFTENYADLESSAVQMLFVHPDSGLLASQSQAAAPPDQTWYYSSGTSNILSRELREILGLEAYLSFPQDELFAPLGMTSAMIEPDPSGTFVASSFGWATARDWARFGQLYLEDGVIDGRRLLPEGWVEYSTTPTPTSPNGLYGAHFWLNAGSPENPETRRWPDLPNNLYEASGFEGQAVVVAPTQRIVIVRLGLSHAGSSWSLPGFLREVLDALVVSPPLAASPIVSADDPDTSSALHPSDVK